MFKPIEPLAQAPCENTEKGVITEVLLRIRVETPVHMKCTLFSCDSRLNFSNSILLMFRTHETLFTREGKNMFAVVVLLQVFVLIVFVLELTRLKQSNCGASATFG